jgi:hypothetical protein
MHLIYIYSCTYRVLALNLIPQLRAIHFETQFYEPRALLPIYVCKLNQ